MKKPLTTKTIEMMKPKDFDKADIGEYSGLRVTCGKTGIKTFFYRYSSPITKKLTQVKIGSFPQTSLAEARKQLKELKSAVVFSYNHNLETSREFFPQL